MKGSITLDGKIAAFSNFTILCKYEEIVPGMSICATG